MASRKWIPSQIRASEGVDSRLPTDSDTSAWCCSPMREWTATRRPTPGAPSRVKAATTQRVTAHVVRVRRCRPRRRRLYEGLPGWVGRRSVVPVGVGGRDGLEWAPVADVVLQPPSLDERVGGRGVKGGEQPGGPRQRQRMAGPSWSSNASRSCRTGLTLKNLAVSVWAAVRSVDVAEPTPLHLVEIGRRTPRCRSDRGRRRLTGLRQHQRFDEAQPRHRHPRCWGLPDARRRGALL